MANKLSCLKEAKQIHFVGIGGIGMSALAKIMLESGYRVSGSDLKSSQTTQQLQEMGATLFVGHVASQVHGSDLIVHSGAVAQDNCELQEAQRLGISVIHRATLLGELMKEAKAIAVTGAHGKTTTCAMILSILRSTGLDPTFLIGGIDNATHTNAHTGNDEIMVVEADESDASFVRLHPTFAVCTNIDREHMDFYPNVAAIQRSLRNFLELVPVEGMIFINQDDAELCHTSIPLQGKKLHCFSVQQKADTWAQVIDSGRPSRFQLYQKDTCLGEVTMQIGGSHNISNAVAAAAVCLHLGCRAEHLIQGLNGYQGVKRRSQLTARCRGITIYDDYAHHPTEIRALLTTLRHETHHRLWAIFQPHRYSRFVHLYDEFLTSFAAADRIVVLPIYSAFESDNSPLQRSPAAFVKDLAHQHRQRADYLPNKEAAVDFLCQQVESGDLLVTIGAGDIDKVGTAMAARLAEDRCIQT